MLPVMWKRLGVVVALLQLVGCGDDDPVASGSGGVGGGAGASMGGNASGGATASGGSAGSGGGGAGGAAGAGAGGSSSGGAGSGGGPTACDYQVGTSGVLVIEAEALSLSGSWQIASAEPGFTGSGYIVWTGASQNNNPGQGLLSAALQFDTAGRYRFRFRNRIGQGTNTTEHNDTWLRFPDAAAHYGMKLSNGLESRRYPRPSCEDASFMAQLESLAQVSSAGCPNGTSADGWLKVYSSGATNWSWSTNTSDNDAHPLFVEIAAPGVFTLQLSARADHHLLDRIVISREDVASSVAEDTSLGATACP